jgi:DNA-binding transcriptional LysR family regulator
MDLDSLRCFELAATTLNFRAAAGRIHLSPAAFSDRIQRLEGDLGLVLFERTTRSVRLTAAGARLLPHARASVAAAEALKREAWGQRDAWELTIGTRYELGLSWLTPALDGLREAVPERTLHLWVGDGPALVEAVRLGRIDAMVSSFRAEADELVSAPLHPEHYRFVGEAGMVAVRSLSGPGDAPAHTLVDTLPSLPLFRYLMDRLGGPIWAFARHEYVGGIGAVRARVLAGRGVAVLPAYFVADDLASGRLVELLPETQPASDQFRLTWRSGHTRGAELYALAEQLRGVGLR